MAANNKPRRLHITCADCRYCRVCLESSRLYPCKDFKPKTKEGGKSDKQGNKKLPQKQACD